MIKKSNTERAKEIVSALYYPVIAVVLALALGAVIIAALGFDAGNAYASLLKGSLGSKNALAETFIKATPLIFTGLSFAIAKRCGLINLGAEGQLFIGGLFATIVGIYVTGLPIYLHLPLALIAGFIGGGLYGLLAAWLKVRFGASELITTIMLNYIAVNLISYFVTGPMKEVGGDFPQTSQLAVTAQLPKLLPGTRLHAGIIVAILCIIFYYVFLWKTSKGYETRVVGLNPGAARYAGMNINRNALLAMFIAGGFAGLAGCSEIMGIQLRLFQNFSPNYGFDGIAVALLGNNTPIGIFISGILFGILRSGSNMMQMTAQVPVSVVQIIQALVILFIVGREMFNFSKKIAQRKAAIAAAKGVE